MADGQVHSNTVRAGVFLVTTLVAGLIVAIILSKTSFAAKQRFAVRFPMAEGVAGIDIGSEVRVAGMKVGRVTSIAEYFTQGRIDVGVEMDASVPVCGDAVVLRSQSLLGNYAWLNFQTLGSGEPLKARKAEDQWIDATPSGGLLATIVGPQNAGRATQMFTDLTTFTSSLSDFATVQYPKKVVPMLDDAGTVVRDLRTDYGTWRADVGSTLTSASSAAKKLDATMDDAKVMAADARAAVAHIREVNLKQVDQLLTEAETGTKAFADSMQALDTELATRLPDIRAMLWDLRQSATQVKLATMEVRRSPWKLLYRPTGDELARENLYESARAFAVASSDLRVAGETLQAALRDAPERFEQDPKLREAIRTQVVDSLGRYETAQRKLFEVLLDGKPLPPGTPITAPPFAAPPPPVTQPQAAEDAKKDS